MSEDNLNPIKDNSDPIGFFGRLRNNKGFINICRSPEGDGGGGGEGEGEGEGEGVGTGTLVPDWREGLEPDIRDHPSLANLKTPGDVAKSYVNQQALIGKRGVPLPDKKSDPTDENNNMEWNTVYDTLGRPSDPKAYELPTVEGSPEVPAEVIDSFKGVAHKAGLLPHQVAALYKWNQEMAVSQAQAGTEQTTKGLQESEASMRKEYGKAFDANLTSARSLLQKFGGDEVIQALEESGLGNNPHMIRFMVKVAGQFTEDGKIQLGDAQPNILSPQDAKMEADKLMADKKGAYWNPANEKGQKQFTAAEHNAMVKRVADLNAMAFPGQA